MISLWSLCIVFYNSIWIYSYLKILGLICFKLKIKIWRLLWSSKIEIQSIWKLITLHWTYKSWDRLGLMVLIQILSHKYTVLKTLGILLAFWASRLFTVFSCQKSLQATLLFTSNEYVPTKCFHYVTEQHINLICIKWSIFTGAVLCSHLKNSVILP